MSEFTDTTWLESLGSARLVGLCVLVALVWSIVGAICVMGAAIFSGLAAISVSNTYGELADLLMRYVTPVLLVAGWVPVVAALAMRRREAFVVAMLMGTLSLIVCAANMVLFVV